MLLFISLLDCYFQRSEFNNTLLYQKEGGGNSHKNIRVLSLLPPLCKNHKKPEVDRKIQAYKTLTLTKGFLFSLCRCPKQSVSRLLSLNCSEHFIWCGCFQICSENNNTSLLLYACEVIHLINKDVTSLYVQE